MSKTARVLLALGGLLAILIVVWFAITAVNAPNDQQLIREALQESIQASREGRPGGVIELLSESFKLNEQEVGINRQVRDFIRDSKPSVKLVNDTAIVTGDEATIKSPADLDLEFLTIKRSFRLDEVTLRFKKEEAREWLIFPTRKWKLVQVEVPPQAMSAFMQ